MNDTFEDVISFIERSVRSLMARKLAVALLGALSIALGLDLLRHGSGVGRGVIASFLVLMGVQILMWLFGIRTELFGTSADTDSGVTDVVGARRFTTIGVVGVRRSTKTEEVEMHDRKIWAMAKVEELGQQKAQLQLELEIAELEFSIAELKSKTSQIRQRTQSN